MAEFLYKREQMPATSINWLMDAFTAFGYDAGLPPPFAHFNEMYKTIDHTPLGDAPWHSFTAEYTGPKPEINVPSWMSAKYEVWCRDPRTVAHNMLANPDFKDEFDAAPYWEYDEEGHQQLSNVLSGGFVWRHAVSFYVYPLRPSTQLHVTLGPSHSRES